MPDQIKEIRLRDHDNQNICGTYIYVGVSRNFGRQDTPQIVGLLL